ncbi:MAG: DUF433 domain-containing protein [Dehalococcoidia bacterium]
MSFSIPSEPLPLAVDVDGVVRVGGTRVTLETVLSVFNQGASPEEIHSDFPSVTLGDIYATIGYYLRHRSEVEGYLSEAERQSVEVRKENEARWDPGEFRQRLRARQRTLSATP